MTEERLLHLDGWRGLAIAMVLLQHFGGVNTPDVGRFGVDLFFVLSGLLMSRILFEQRMPIGKFYRRRISRIMPVFLLFVSVCWIGWSGYGASWRELVTTLTFTRTYYVHPGIWHSVLPDGNLWSLNVEEQSYIILATMAAFPLLRKRATWILFGIAVAFLPAVKLHMRFESHVPMLTIECAGGGLFLSAAYRSLAGRWTAPPWVAPLALLVAFACYFGFGPWYLTITLSPLLLAFSVNHIGHSWLRRAFEWLPLRQLGILSYSIYLWQQMFIDHRFGLSDPAALACALAAGVASFYLFEQPARRWLNSRWSGYRPAAYPHTA